jgi:hypothetical protein
MGLAFPPLLGMIAGLLPKIEKRRTQKPARGCGRVLT